MNLRTDTIGISRKTTWRVIVSIGVFDFAIGKQLFEEWGAMPLHCSRTLGSVGSVEVLKCGAMPLPGARTLGSVCSLLTVLVSL